MQTWVRWTIGGLILLGLVIAAQAWSRAGLRVGSIGQGFRVGRTTATASGEATDPNVIWYGTFTDLGDTCKASPYTPAIGANVTFTRGSGIANVTSLSTLIECASNDTLPLSGTYGLLGGTPGADNYILYSQQLDNAAWTNVTATVTANDTTAPDGTLTADKVVLLAGVSHLSQDTFGVAPSFWLKRVSTSGLVNVTKTSGGLAGFWEVDLSLLDDNWNLIGQQHPAVTVYEQFAKIGDGSGYCDGTIVCNGGCNDGAACTTDSECDCNLWPGLDFSNTGATPITVWLWNVSQSTSFESRTSKTTATPLAEYAEYATTTGLLNGTAGSGSFTFTPDISSSGYAGTWVALRNVASKSVSVHLTGGAVEMVVGSATASATYYMQRGVSVTVRWRYGTGTGKKACIKVDANAEVCSASDVGAAWSPDSTSTLASSPIRGWFKNIRFCSDNSTNCVP